VDSFVSQHRGDHHRNSAEMGCLRCCGILVLLVAVLAPIGFSFSAGGRVLDLFPGWRPTDMPDLSGKVVIVTGPTVKGIGHESGVEMARRGAHVILAGRSESKGEEAVKELLARVPAAKAEFMTLDLASLKSVKAFVEAFKAKELPLHILMNSAGVMACPFGLTVDGLESQWATNHLGHFLLTKLLLPTLEASAPSRVVTVSSGAANMPDMFLKMQQVGLVDAGLAVDFDTFGPENEEGYHPWKSYGRSKLSNVLFTRALARRLSGKKVYANVNDPGGIKTNLGRHAEVTMKESMGEAFTRFMDSFTDQIFMTPPMGAVTQLYLATAPEVETQDIRGQFYKPQAKPATLPGLVTEVLEEKLWAASEKLVAAYL